MRVRREPGRGVEVIRRAVELGANLIDTADVYGAGTSEELVAEALHPYPEGVVIATKGGITYDPDAARPRDGRPEYLRRAVERSLQRLRLERIELYQLHRHDPDVPLEESVGALAELSREGMIHHVGLSNVSVEQLRRAQAVTPIATVQNEYSRGFTVSEEVLRACEADGVGFLPWRPLGDGYATDPAAELRWLLERSPVMVPIPGTSSIEHLEANMAALAG
jgi:aryl-alcohol dehydrogenase-like predicted oxidoreductase